jgi:D-glycero-alpha-D-manno-heptose-7-phosphate kinase
VTASVIPRSDNEIHVYSRDLDIRSKAENLERIDDDPSLSFIKAPVKLMQLDFGFELETYSELEVGTGLGGSSAVVVAVLAALNYFKTGCDLDRYDLADLAYQAERIDMDIAGGWQDQYATAFGGFNWIEFNKEQIIVNPLKVHRDILLELECNLVMFRISGSHNSGQLQTKLKSVQSKAPDNYRRDVREFMRITRKMKSLLLRGKVKKFGDTLHESWEMKKRLSTVASNPNVERLYKIARDSPIKAFVFVINALFD